MTVNTFASAALALLPDWFHQVSGESQEVLRYAFFKIGGLAVTPLFLIKAVLFVAVLIFISNLLQKFVLGRVFQHVSISDSLKFALSRFATYLFFLGGLFVGLQSLGVNLNSLVVFGGAVGVGWNARPFLYQFGTIKLVVRGAFDGTRQEAYGGADCEPATAG